MTRCSDAPTPDLMPLLLAEAGVRTGDRILDVGCGDGSLVDALCGSGYDAYGIDDDAIESKRTIAQPPAAGVGVESASVRLAIVRGGSGLRPGELSFETHVAMANVVAALSGNGVIALFGRDETESPLLADYGMDVALTPLCIRPGLVGRLLGRKGPEVGAILLGRMPGSPLSKLECHAIARTASQPAIRRAA